MFYSLAYYDWIRQHYKYVKAHETTSRNSRFDVKVSSGACESSENGQKHTRYFRKFSFQVSFDLYMQYRWECFE